MNHRADRPHTQAVACGIGLRAPHARELATRRPPLGCLEVHSENFFAAGGAARAMLMALREHYSVSLHGVGLSLGSAIGLDLEHLQQLRNLVRDVAPVRVSDHASFARGALPGRASTGQTNVHANDLLPIAFTHASLDLLARNVDQAQAVLGCGLLVENLSAYVAWEDADFDEPAFFNALMRRTGCGLLLDVNNLVVNELNRAGAAPAGRDMAAARDRACRWIDALVPAGLGVGEIHLAGHHDTGDLVIDDHGSRIAPAVWQVYRHALQRLGPVPALVEWDTDLPPLQTLLGEAAQADVLADLLADVPTGTLPQQGQS